MHTFQVKTPARECLVDITGSVGAAIAESSVREGLCTVYVPHTTAGVTINENADPDVSRDIIAFLSEAVPRNWPYRHVEGNSDAHIKASLVGSSVQVPVSRGRPALGTWQGIYFAEFDGPRTRRVHVVVQGERP
ncbi:MAG: secondary thiamine-phosphate synthase enzyme YjbQ [Deferrisomatales bacterium]